MRLLVAFTLLAAALSAQTEDPFSSATFNGLKLRSIGPAVASGRVVSIAVDPRNTASYYVGVASGGVWKTTNNGTTWTPVFDNEGSYSIGVVSLDPKNPNTVWVGSGENNSQRSVSYGDGVYRSDDGGKSWRNMGLKKSEHIGRVLVDPRNSNIVYLAAAGPLWGPGGDRGVFKSTDGGKTWKNVLTISENTGVNDLAIDPSNPDVLLAASYQRRRHYWTLIDGGPESAIYKSTDAGATWRKVASGLPKEEMGRIALTFSPAQPGLVYARLEAANKAGGVFRSMDSGESWEKRNGFDDLAMYYGQIIADPKDADRVYVPNTLLRVSDDGGKTLRPVGDRSKHVDSHTVWIDPADTRHIMVGCDGGLYESYDRGQIWNFKANLPTVQFYDVEVDNSKPFYFVYGGTQDNATLGGPANTRNAAGITNADWFVTVFGDGFQTRVDPEDPNTVYSEMQYGGLVRYDRRTGERVGIKPVEGKGEPPLRWNWDSPVYISPHSHTRLYFGANKLFRSDDRGDSWKAVSPDLSKQINRDTLPVMGRVWPADAVAKHNSTAFYGNLTTISESPKREGLIYIGTDDGLVQATENSGGAWRKSGALPGVPELAYVTRVLASQHDENTVYATVENHQNADFKPYVLKSADRGRTWTAIAGDLPANGTVWAIAEDPANPRLLFVGTEYGMYFTVDGGSKWVRMKGGLPTIAVRDITIQKREGDLAIATFGRGFYVLDNYSALRTMTPDTLKKDAVLFPVRPATEMIKATPLGLRGKAHQGEAFYTADNAPDGALFTYYLRNTFETRRQQRERAEKEAENKKQPLVYPTLEQLSEEAEEEPPAVSLTITDASGKIVRRLTAPGTKGLNRVAWNLRLPAPTLPPPRQREEGDEDPGEEGPSGWLVAPGTYRATLAAHQGGKTTQLGEPVSFQVAAEEGAPRSDFYDKLARLQRAASGAMETASSAKTRIATIKRALNESTAEPRLHDEADRLEARVNRILRALRGDEELARRQENQPPTILERVSGIAGGLRSTTGPPTRTHQEQYEIASAELGEQIGLLRTLVDTHLRSLERELEAANVPHTPGRIPEWR